MGTTRTVLIVSVFLLTGCAQVPRDGDFPSVKGLVGERIPQNIHWYQGSEEDEQVKAALDVLLKQPLTATSAVQIALLNNRRLQVEYEDLGIAQADLVQAGLLSNPVLFASIRFPNSGKGTNNTQFEIAKDFLDILLRPARQRIAAEEFDRVKLRVANAVLDLAAEAQTAFYRTQGRQQLVKIFEVTAGTSRISYELAQRFDEAGNLSELELAQERGAAAEMSAELLRVQAELQTERDNLNRLMGLTGSTAGHLMLGLELPELPAIDPELELVQKAAYENRLDLIAAQHEINQLEQAHDLTRDYRWIGGASFGVNTERDTDGSSVTGPNFSVEIPIFDQRQAEIARLESFLEQSKSRYAALRVAIESEVEAAVNRVKAARSITLYYRDELVPAREQVVEFTQQEQNYMLVDVFELLFARLQQTLAYRGYIESLTSYWTARAELARAIGIGLPLALESAATPSSGQQMPEQPDTGPEQHNQMHH